MKVKSKYYTVLLNNISVFIENLMHYFRRTKFDRFTGFGPSLFLVILVIYS